MKPASLILLLGLCLSGQDPRRRIMPPEIVIPAPVRDVLKLDPKHCRLEFENEKVRVLRVKLGPDETVPLHDDPAATLVCISECHLRLTRPDGRIQDVHMEAGQTRWIWDDARAEKNLSTHPAELLFIETKEVASAARP